MDKSEFLNILRQSLSGEVTNEVIEQNIRYYDGYISGETLEAETVIIDRIGDPRLIAKTIIEAEKASREKNINQWNSTNYQNQTSKTEEDFQESSSGYRGHTFFANMKWYHKLIAILIVILLFVITAVIGKLVIGFIFAFGLPILLVLLVLSLFRKR